MTRQNGPPSYDPQRAQDVRLAWLDLFKHECCGPDWRDTIKLSPRGALREISRNAKRPGPMAIPEEALTDIEAEQAKQ